MMTCSNVAATLTDKTKTNDGLLYQSELQKEKIENPPLKVFIVVQARMGSSRLPGKVMKKVMGRPLLQFMLQRLKRVKLADGIIIATTDNPGDSQIVRFCHSQEIFCFAGSENDVLDRYFQAATNCQADVIVRITADCPLIDPILIDKLISAYLDMQPNCAYLSNTLKRTFPRGMDIEVFSYKSLETAAREAVLPYDREHVTPYIYHHPELFSLEAYTETEDNSHYRLTVDYPEDFLLVTKVLEKLYVHKPHFTLEDILELLKRFPKWTEINKNVENP